MNSFDDAAITDYEAWSIKVYWLRPEDLSFAFTAMMAKGDAAKFTIPTLSPVQRLNFGLKPVIVTILWF